ncbi:ADP-ribosyltransferase [Mycobacterium sp. 050272]|uniref:ADP-ribosyltransferase n=1 Tax=Mycobacterium sp. 050272 TaxID=3142488 RepID=UPI00319698AF
MDASIQARVDAVNRALDKLPIYDGVGVRGTNVPPEVLERYQPGRVVSESAFVSTSTDPAAARSPAFPGNTEFRILSTSTGRDISAYSVHPGERELLFPSGSKFYILNRTTEPQTGRIIVEMMDVNPRHDPHSERAEGAFATSEKIAGKNFFTPKEAGVTPPARAEMTRARRAFDQFQIKVDAVSPEDIVQEVSSKFWDDISGTEYDPKNP